MNLIKFIKDQCELIFKTQTSFYTTLSLFIPPSSRHNDYMMERTKMIMWYKMKFMF